METKEITIIDIKKLKCFDGLYYSFELIEYYHSGLYKHCCNINENSESITPALASCWGFIDALHRIREITQSIPSLSTKHPEVRKFLDFTSIAEDYRHYMQHLRRELVKSEPNTFPVWGAIAWIDEIKAELSYLAILGVQIEGTNYSGCVYDTFKKKWVSRVTLGIENKSFNFDPIFEATMNFKKFVMPFMLASKDALVEYNQNKLPIIQLSIFHGNI